MKPMEIGNSMKRNMKTIGQTTDHNGVMTVSTK